MKTRILLLLAIIICTLGFAENSLAQFGGLVNKAKDAAAKKEKKVEAGTPEKVRGEKSTETNRSISPATQNQLGTVYFANQPFSGDGGVSGAKTSFNSNEFIYARLILKTGKVQDILKPVPPGKDIKGYNIDFRLYTIMENRSIRNLGRNFRAIINQADLDKTYLDFDIFPSPENAKSAFFWGGNPNDGISYGFDMYLFLTNSQTAEGTYKVWNEIKIQSVDFRGNPLPENESLSIRDSFDITFRGSDFQKIKSNKEKLDREFEANYKAQKIANEPLPAEWSANSSPIIAGNTVATITKLYLNSFSNPAGTLKLIRFHAAPPRGQGVWIIQNNEYGIPSYRYSTQWFTAFVKDSVNGVCFYQGFGLRQNYAGAGTYNGTIIDYGNSAVITCDKLGLK